MLRLMSILTIQSHVSYGHVGNAAAVFPLQRLGYEVWPVNTVLFSNHAGYPTVKGPVLPAQDVADVIQGIGERGVFSSCEAILSGYLGSVELGEVVLSAVKQVQEANNSALYCCDPVMGDRGKDIYVHPDIPDFIGREVLPKADILIPNHFELETLSGSSLTTISDIISATRKLIEVGPDVVIVTSVETSSDDPDTISMLAVSKDQVFKVQTPKLPFDIQPSGSGDLSAAIYLAHYLKCKKVDQALAQMVASVYSLLHETLAMKSDEIALIKAQDMISEPRFTFDVQELSVS